MKFLILSAFLGVIIGVTWGYSAGAPETVCDDMTPKHPVPPQNTPIPYTVTIDKSEIKKGDTAKLIIKGKPFKGYLVQIRDGEKAVGSFQIPDTDRFSKVINCHGSKGSGATHKNSVQKKDLPLIWKAPSKAGTYKVYLTAAEDGGTFWVRKPQATIKVY